MMLMILFSISSGWLLHCDWFYIALLLAAGNCCKATIISQCFTMPCIAEHKVLALAVATLIVEYTLPDNSLLLQCHHPDSPHFSLLSTCFIKFANTITPFLTAHFNFYLLNTSSINPLPQGTLLFKGVVDINCTNKIGHVTKDFNIVQKIINLFKKIKVNNTDRIAKSSLVIVVEWVDSFDSNMDRLCFGTWKSTTHMFKECSSL